MIDINTSEDDTLLPPVYTDCERGHKRNLNLAPICTVCDEDYKDRVFSKKSSLDKKLKPRHKKMGENKYICGRCEKEDLIFRRVDAKGKTRGYCGNCKKRIY